MPGKLHCFDSLMSDSLMPSNSYPWVFPKLCSFVREHRRAVTASNGSGRVSAEANRRARSLDMFTRTAGQSLESMTPSVIWLDFFVRSTR